MNGSVKRYRTRKVAGDMDSPLEEMFKAIDDHIFIWMITVRNGMEGLSNKKMFFKDVASFRIRAAERVFLFIIQYRHFIMISSMRTTIMKEARSRFSQI